MEKKFWFQMIGLIVVILLATFLAFNYRYLIPITSQFSHKPRQEIQAKKEILKIVDKNENLKAELKIEVAQTNEKRNKGLGFRESLATDSGMLFIHDSPKKYTYWMKGMQFPIDIMWILNDKIVDIIPNIPPPIKGQSDDTLERYSPTVDINRVLETNAGFVSEQGIQVGDKIIFDK